MAAVEPHLAFSIPIGIPLLRLLLAVPRSFTGAAASLLGLVLPLGGLLLLPVLRLLPLLLLLLQLLQLLLKLLQARVQRQCMRLLAYWLQSGGPLRA